MGVAQQGQRQGVYRPPGFGVQQAEGLPIPLTRQQQEPLQLPPGVLLFGCLDPQSSQHSPFLLSQ